jgi:hypothetical protein
VFDVAGRLVQTLEEGGEDVGSHQVIFDSLQTAQWNLVCQLKAEEGRHPKMALLK